MTPGETGYAGVQRRNLDQFSEVGTPPWPPPSIRRQSPALPSSRWLTDGRYLRPRVQTATNRVGRRESAEARGRQVQ